MLGYEPCGNGEILEAGKNWTYLTSPNYPSKYNKNETCTWSITPGLLSCDKLKVELILLRLSLENNYDFLYIRGDTLSPSKNYTGRSGIDDLMQSTFFNVTFTSDEETARKGFKLKYRCAQLNWCETNPCLNAGTCDPSTETCKCLNGVTGPICNESEYSFRAFSIH